MTENKSEAMGTIKCWSHEIREPNCEACRSEAQPPADEAGGLEKARKASDAAYDLAYPNGCEGIDRAVFRQGYLAAYEASRPAAGTSEQEATSASVTAMREALHEIDVEVFNTIPPDGNEAAWAALARIRDILAPFRNVQPGAALQEQKP